MKSNKNTFDTWFDALSKDEQSELIRHILETRIDIGMEGYPTGPVGKLLEGLYVGPSGGENMDRCSKCGKLL